MIRVLQIMSTLDCGGAENMIMNLYRNIDRTKVQFDFLLRSKNGIYEEEVKEMGGRIFYTPEYPRHFLKNKSYNFVTFGAGPAIFTTFFHKMRVQTEKEIILC